MKSYAEMAESVLGRIHAYEASKRRRRKTALSLASGLGAAALVGVAVWQSGLLPKNGAPPLPNEHEVVWGSAGDLNPDYGFSHWADKPCSIPLQEALTNSTGEETIFAVLVTKPGEDVPPGFCSGGKTYAQLTQEYEILFALNQKYGSLVKEGEHLKYGESLYTTGNADGVKWAKELYDERVAFYGTEFLNKYIVNQEFLLELLLTDQEEVFSRLQKTETAFYKASELFRRQFAARELDAFIALGIAAENRQDELLIYVTAAELAELKLKDSSQYMFWLAPRDKEPADL
jgi:hypothetical protein